ncbi:MAG: hypothetical protein ABIA63_13995 [bacterium]
MLDNKIDKRKPVWGLIVLLLASAFLLVNRFTLSEEEEFSSNTAGTKIKDYNRKFKNIISGELKKQSFEFGEINPDPFKTGSGRGHSIKPKTAAIPVPRNLRVKGILAKKPLMALVQDNSGRTHMVREGQAIGAFTVEKISRNSVIFRDINGTFVLEVK